jgi:hypothetical protein
MNRREPGRLTRSARPAPPAAPDSFVYLYAATLGRPSSRALARLPVMPDAGGARVVALGDSVALIVSDVPAAVYRPDAIEPRLGDSEWVARSGTAHHAVAETLSRSHAVLPFRIFTVFSTEARMLRELRRSQRRLAAALARLKGRDEWVLRVGPPSPARPTTSARGDAANQLEPVSGARFLRAKAEARRAETDRLRRAASASAALFASLSERADEAVARPAPPGTTLLLDAAFLIKRRDTARFRRALGRAAKPLLDDGCAVSFTGPWPAYSFAAIE